MTVEKFRPYIYYLSKLEDRSFSALLAHTLLGLKKLKVYGLRVGRGEENLLPLPPNSPKQT